MTHEKISDSWLLVSKNLSCQEVPAGSLFTSSSSHNAKQRRRSSSDTSPLERIHVFPSLSPPPDNSLWQGASILDYQTINEPAKLAVVKHKGSSVNSSETNNVPIKDKSCQLARDHHFASIKMTKSCSLDALNDIGDWRKRSDGYRGSQEEIRIRATAMERVQHMKHPESPLAARQGNSVTRLFSHQQSVEELLKIIESGADVNALDEMGNAHIHTIITEKHKNKLEMLLCLLVNSKVDVNRQNLKGNTALHLAVEEGEVMCIKALVAFGADLNKPGSNEFTPLDLVINSGHLSEIETLFQNLNAKGSARLMYQSEFRKVHRMHSFAENMRPLSQHKPLLPTDRLQDYVNKQGVWSLYQELQSYADQRSSMSVSQETDMHEVVALFEQQKELRRYNKTLQQSVGRPRCNTSFSLKGGSRILFLDGGGVKGLVEIEILMQIEEATGRTVVELFDWIVGTSTGGVIALALVYGKKSLNDLRQLYFKLKDRIFMKGHHGFAYDSEVLDEILQEYLDPETRLSEISHPKVLIAAVNKTNTNLKLHFFNNCFGDEFCDYLVWKVARYTSSAPMFFTEMDNYVDGGVICNNPTECGLTKIQDFCREQGMKLPISVVVSIGSGQCPPQTMGEVDAQKALFFGKQWLRPDRLIKNALNLTSFILHALVESETVAANSESRCREQNIPFFRFSPELKEVIAAGEIDNEKLLSMIIQTRINFKDDPRLNELIKLFHKIAEVNHAPHHQSIPEEEMETEESLYNLSKGLL